MASDRPFYARHADAYDLLITDPAEPWVDAVHDRLTGPATILDAGCGTGRHAAGLTAKGHRVDLADASAELLAQAAARCPAARTFLVDLREMRIPAVYDAVTCRGVLNDLITDRDRQAAVQSLSRCLTPGGRLFLDVREQTAARQRANGAPRTRKANLPNGQTLTFTSRTTWSNGLLHIEETYELPNSNSTYHFTMRPWTKPELHKLLTNNNLQNIKITPGAGRQTPDRLFITASETPAH